MTHMPTEVIGEIDGISYNPEDETITLKGEYGMYVFQADGTTRTALKKACNRIENPVEQ